MLKKIIILVIFIILSASLTANYFLYQKISGENLVVKVVDGDTFQLKSGKRVRLLGVDAPEYNRCAGPESRQRLTNLILGKKVRLEEETSESFGRSLALTYVSKRLINEIILKEGWGRPDYRKNSKRNLLTKAFHYAKDNNLGIFSPLCREPSQKTPKPLITQTCPIKGNIDKNTYKKFYHLPGCKHYDEVIIEKDIGERYFCTESEASASGFTKSSSCPQ